MRKIVCILATLLLVAAWPSLAQHKCTDDKGRVIYQQTPCPGEKKDTIQAISEYLSKTWPAKSVSRSGDGDVVIVTQLKDVTWDIYENMVVWLCQVILKNPPEQPFRSITITNQPRMQGWVLTNPAKCSEFDLALDQKGKDLIKQNSRSWR